MEEQTATTKKAKALATDTLAILLVFALTFAALTYWFGTANAQGGGSTNGTGDAEAAAAAETPDYKVELVEQQRDGDGKLVPFVQGKTLMPVTVEEEKMGDLDGFGLPTAANYVDKIVTAKNVGAEDAYIRIIVAVPAALDDWGGFHWDTGSTFNSKNTSGVPFVNNEGKDYTLVPDVTLDNVWVNGSQIEARKYNLYVFTCSKALSHGQSTAAAMTGMYLDKSVDHDKVTDQYTYVDANGAITFSGEELSEHIAIPIVVQAASAESPINPDSTDWNLWRQTAVIGKPADTTA